MPPFLKCAQENAPFFRMRPFESQVTGISPYFGRKNEKFQIDLIFTRSDRVITICEIKFQMGEIGTKVIPEIERKCKLIKIPKVFTIDIVLIETIFEA